MLLVILSILTTLLLGPVLLIAITLRFRRKAKTIGFFHPYCNAGGGGERVLFCAIKTIPEDYHIILYTGDKENLNEIIQKCQDRFGKGSTPPNLKNITLIHLKTRWLVEASLYPRFTMIGQSIGSIILGLEALFKFTPEIYMDTMGYAFTYPAAKFLAGSTVCCYVHYPTISSDMLNRVIELRPSYDDENSRISSSFFSPSLFKYYYYLSFAVLYKIVGKCSKVVLVNSSWTKNHIDSLWGTNSRLVYPPSLTEQEEEKEKDLNDENREAIVISIGQFRPEKDHRLQLSSIAQYKKMYSSSKDLKLVMIGSCRGKEDEARVIELHTFATLELGLKENIDYQIIVNVSRQVLDEEYYSKALIGLHTMWNEHFGIGIVEMMAFGVIVVAHNSGGPKTDIIQNTLTGYLATTSQEYATAFNEILRKDDKELMEIRKRAKKDVLRFTEKEFERNFVNSTKQLFSGKDEIVSNM